MFHRATAAGTTGKLGLETNNSGNSKRAALCDIGHAIVYTLFLLTYVLRWFPAVAAGLFVALALDLQFTEAPLLDAWFRVDPQDYPRVQVAAGGWNHWAVFVVMVWLAFEATLWPLYLLAKAKAYSAQRPTNPVDNLPNREALYTAMIDSFSTFKKVRAHPVGSHQAKAELRRLLDEFVRGWLRHDDGDGAHLRKLDPQEPIKRCDLKALVRCGFFGHRTGAWA